MLACDQLDWSDGVSLEEMRLQGFECTAVGFQPWRLKRSARGYYLRFSNDRAACGLDPACLEDHIARRLVALPAAACFRLLRGCPRDAALYHPGGVGRQPACCVYHLPHPRLYPEDIDRASWRGWGTSLIGAARRWAWVIYEVTAVCHNQLNFSGGQRWQIHI